MGMFDNIICEYPLPGNPVVLEWQTKSLGCEMDTYIVAADGTLWIEDYDVQDQSDFALGKGQDKFMGCMTRVNQRRVQVTDFRGEVRFYGSASPDWSNRWEFSALFDDGKLLSMKQISPEPSPVEPAVELDTMNFTGES